jgi:antitoxin PrlF
MPSSRLSTKGQIVIPREIREWLGLRPGDRIDFVVEEHGSVRLRPALLDVRDLRGLLSNTDRPPVSVEAMNEAMNEAVREAASEAGRAE